MLVFGFLSIGRTDDGAASLPLRSDLKPTQRVTAHIDETNIAEAVEMYAELTGRRWLRGTNTAIQNVSLMTRDRIAQWGWVRSAPKSGTIQYHADGARTVSELKEELEALFKRNDVEVAAQGEKAFRVSEREKGR
jgi:hypothetical protein